MDGPKPADRPLYQFAERYDCGDYIPRPPVDRERARRLYEQALAWHGLRIEPRPDDPQE